MFSRTKYILQLVVLACSFATSLNAQTDQQFDSLDVYFKKGDQASILQLCDRILETDNRQFNAWAYKGDVYLQQKKYKEAGDCYGRAAHIFTDYGYLTNAAFSYLLAGEYDSTESLCRIAIKYYPEDFNHYLNLAHCFFLKNDLVNAEYYYNISLDYIPYHPQYFQGVETDLHMLDSLQPSKSISFIRNAFLSGEKLLEKNKMSNLVLDSIYEVMQSNRLDRSNELRRLKLAFINAQNKEGIRRYSVLRDFYYQLAYYEQYYDAQKYQDYLEKGISTDRLIGDSISLFNNLMQFSDYSLTIALAKNKYQPNCQDAINMANEAVVTADKFRLPLKYKAYVQLGQIYYQSNQFSKAAQNFEKAIKLMPKSKRFGVFEETAFGLMLSYSNLNKDLEVQRYYQLLMSREPLVSDPEYDFFRVKLEYQNILYSLRRYSVILKNFQTLKDQYSIDHNTREKFSNLYETVGLCFYKTGNIDSAIWYLKESIRLFNLYTKEKGFSKEQMPEFSSLQRKDATAALKNIFALTGDIASAFEWVERTKESLLNYYIRNEPNPEHVSSLGELQKALPDDAAGLVYFNFSLNQGNSLGFSHTDQKMLIHDSTVLYREFRKDSNYSAIMAMVNKRTENKDRPYLAVELFGFLSRKDVSERGALPISTKTDAWANPDGWRISLSKLLYKIYLKPYDSLLQGKRIVYISADQALNYIPFEALIDENGHYFGEKYSVVYVPSFTIQKTLAQRKIAKGDRLILFGNPDYESYHPDLHSALAWNFSRSWGIKSWEKLPGTKLEIDSIRHLWTDSRSIQQKQLSESGIKKMSEAGELRDLRFMHFALHGFVDIDLGPEGSTIIISEPDNGEDDGLLNFFEASNLDIHARLVCLSACETAYGFPADDGSCTSMTNAFLVAGAAACVGTNWSISDKASMLFMREFYSLIKKGIEIPEALHFTRKKFISGEMGDQYRAPYYWAPFKYYGL